jgi:hypothetical protein
MSLTVSPGLAGTDEERTSWLKELKFMMDQAAEWSHRQDWTVRRDTKPITEPAFGTYTAPVLLIHTPQGRLILDPIGRDIVGAEGRIDLCVMPSYDPMPLVKGEHGWEFWSPKTQTPGRSWNETDFVTVARELLREENETP